MEKSHYPPPLDRRSKKKDHRTGGLNPQEFQGQRITIGMTFWSFRVTSDLHVKVNRILVKGTDTFSLHWDCVINGKI